MVLLQVKEKKKQDVIKKKRTTDNPLIQPENAISRAEKDTQNEKETNKYPSRNI